MSSYQPPRPSFHVVVWVVGPLLVLPKVREGIPFLFAGVLVFFPNVDVKKWVHGDTKRLAVGFRVAWLVVALVGCWLIGSGTAEFGWLVGWLVGWFVGLLVGWLLASCWGVCVCIVHTHAVWRCCTVCPCVSLYVQQLQRSWGGVVHISFWRFSGVLARCSSGVLGSEAAPLERR